jgi:hypothetical protein
METFTEKKKKKNKIQEESRTLMCALVSKPGLRISVSPDSRKRSGLQLCFRERVRLTAGT